MTRHRAEPAGKDFYVTPAGTAWHGAMLLKRELDNVPLGIAPKVIDAGCGTGALAAAVRGIDDRVLIDMFDLEIRHDGAHQLDLFDEAEAERFIPIHERDRTLMITNPPYTKWRQFVNALVERASVVVALGPVTLLDTALKLPQGLTSVNMTARPRFLGSEHQHPMPHAWFVFYKMRAGTNYGLGRSTTFHVLSDALRDEIKKRSKS